MKKLDNVALNQQKSQICVAVAIFVVEVEMLSMFDIEIIKNYIDQIRFVFVIQLITLLIAKKIALTDWLSNPNLKGPLTYL